MMFVTMDGTRGSYPVPNKSTNRYGGNTTSCHVWKENATTGQKVAIGIDTGTGAISRGDKMIKDYLAKRHNLCFTILYSHLHPDHTQGFPFFAPVYFPSANLHFVGMETLEQNIGDVLEGIMQPPTFPIEINDMKSKKTFHVVEDGQSFVVLWTGEPVFDDKYVESQVAFKVKTMKAYAASHPQQGAMYYRITDPETGNSFCTIWDNESHQGGDVRVIAFAEGCTLMAHDTMYTDEEYSNRKIPVQGFGHSTYSMAINNAYQAGAKKLLCMHYNPKHSDEFLDDYKNSVDAISAMSKPENALEVLPVIFSVEGEIYEV